MIDVAVYDLVIRKGWKNQIFTVSGNFTAPISGLYFLNGVGGGAAGRVGADSGDTAGGGAGESVAMFPVYLSAGTIVAITIGAGGTGDGGNGGNTTIGSYLTLYGGGVAGSAASNYLGGGIVDADGRPRAYNTNGGMVSAHKLSGANASSGSLAVSTSGHSDFPNGLKGGTYMWGGAGSKYAAGGAGNASGVGVAGSLGSGGGSGTTAAGAGGSGKLEIMWQE